jgi:hypothetical protein
MKTTPPQLRRLRSLISSLAAIALAATGCHVTGPYEPTPPNDAASALQTLQSLPSLEDTQRQVQAVMDDVKSAAAQFVPAITWISPHAGSGLGCQKPYEQTEGKGYILPDEIAVDVPVSEEQWSQIQDAAKKAAVSLEANEIQVMQNQPGFHDVGFYGPAGLFIKVAYHGNLVVSGYTGCRLPHEKN